jgi:hypothetical protein
MEHIEILKLVLNAAIVPAAIWAYKINSTLESINKKLDKIETIVERNEERNHHEHDILNVKLHELDKRNSIEHAQLGLRSVA